MAFEFKGNKAAPQKQGGFSIGGQGGVPDPLAEVEYTGELDKDCGAEISALQAGMAQRAKAEEKRKQKATDSEFWFAVCFESREEKEAFLKAAKMSKRMFGDKYIEGKKMAKLLGIEM